MAISTWDFDVPVISNRIDIVTEFGVIHVAKKDNSYHVFYQDYFKPGNAILKSPVTKTVMDNTITREEFYVTDNNQTYTENYNSLLTKIRLLVPEYVDIQDLMSNL